MDAEVVPLPTRHDPLDVLIERAEAADARARSMEIDRDWWKHRQQEDNRAFQPRLTALQDAMDRVEALCNSDKKYISINELRKALNP